MKIEKLKDKYIINKDGVYMALTPSQFNEIETELANMLKKEILIDYAKEVIVPAIDSLSNNDKENFSDSITKIKDFIDSSICKNEN